VAGRIHVLEHEHHYHDDARHAVDTRRAGNDQLDRLGHLHDRARHLERKLHARTGSRWRNREHITMKKLSNDAKLAIGAGVGIAAVAGLAYYFSNNASSTTATTTATTPAAPAATPAASTPAATSTTASGTVQATQAGGTAQAGS
jgi:hypothetical protein